MIAEVVLDTNVLVYAVSKAADDAAKRRIALELIDSRRVGLSGQILQEFFVVVTRKNRVVLTVDQALDWLESLEDFPIVAIDASLVRRGAELSARYQISYFDAAVIAAAQVLQAGTLYTEDLNHNQLYGGVRVVNPFRGH